MSLLRLNEGQKQNVEFGRPSSEFVDWKIGTPDLPSDVHEGVPVRTQVTDDLTCQWRRWLNWVFLAFGDGHFPVPRAVQHPGPQQSQAGPAVHAAFQSLEAVHLALDLTVAPG